MRFFINPLLLLFLALVSESRSQTLIQVDPYQEEYVIVVESQPGAKLFYIPSNSDGTFGSHSLVADIGFRAGAGVADFDNDDDLDFGAGARQASCAAGGACLSFYLFENLGGGTFEQRLVESDVPAGPLTNYNVPTNFAIADFNEDGYEDFAVGVYQSSFVYLFSNNGDKTFSRSTLAPLADTACAKAGDFNEDGHPDFLITEYFARNVYLYQGDGTGGFTKQFVFTIPGPRAAFLAVGDFNEDGHLDAIVDGLFDKTGYLYVGDGGGNFSLAGAAYIRPSQTGLDAFDFDKDGHLDLMVSDYENFSGNAYFKKGNGNGTFQPDVLVASGLASHLIPVAPSEPGQPMLLCNGLEPTIVGTTGSDFISGTKTDDVIVGLGGNDFIVGDQGNDVICAGAGNDLVDGGKGDDSLFGQAGVDTLLGGKGLDTILGSHGSDVLIGGPGDDTLDGGDGFDICDDREGNDTVQGCERTSDTQP